MSKHRFRIQPGRLLLGAAILLVTLSAVALQGRLAASKPASELQAGALRIEALYSDDPALRLIDTRVASLFQGLLP